MYQTERSQRVFWGEKRKQIQKENRSLNINKIIKQDQSIVNKGWKKNNFIHNLIRQIIINKYNK